MKEKEITALAREYADVLKHLFPDMPEHTYRDKMSQAKNVINIIMRRYCLVEKEVVRKQFESAKRLIEAHNYNKQCIGVGSRGVLERLFPEIANEVEE